MIFWVLSLPCQAQTTSVDQLRKAVRQAGDRQDSLAVILDLCALHYNLQRDTLDKYAYLAQNLALHHGNSLQQARAALALANDYQRWGWTDSCLAVISQGLAYCNVKDDGLRKVYFDLSRLKALCYGSRADYAKALDLLYHLVTETTTYRDSLYTGLNSNTIASIALARGKAQEALKWTAKAQGYAGIAPRFLQLNASIAINRANAFQLLKQRDSALLMIGKALPLSRACDNLNILSTALRVSAAIEQAAGHLATAEKNLLEMIRTRSKTGDETQFVDDRVALIDFYRQNHQLDKAIEYCLAALQRGNVYAKAERDAATYINKAGLRLTFYEALAACYQEKGDHARYEQTLEQIIGAKDTLYETNSARAIAEMQTKYEVQQKENTIIQQQLDLSRRNNLVFGSLAVLVIVLLSSGMLFMVYRRQHKLRIAAAEEKERRRISADLHDNLGAYAASIATNIGYINPSIQDAASAAALHELSRNAGSMITELNNTIWALKHHGLSLTAISDRLKLVLQRLAPSYPHVCMDVCEQLATDQVLPPSQAYHLFRIIQEAVNNALRHSGGQRLQVLFKAGVSGWEVQVTDDGKGFDTEAPLDAGAGGNGLHNMRQRAGQQGWSLRWQAAGGCGTMVTICTTN